MLDDAFLLHQRRVGLQYSHHRNLISGWLSLDTTTACMCYFSDATLIFKHVFNLCTHPYACISRTNTWTSTFICCWSLKSCVLPPILSFMWPCSNLYIRVWLTCSPIQFVNSSIISSIRLNPALSLLWYASMIFWIELSLPSILCSYSHWLSLRWRFRLCWFLACEASWFQRIRPVQW